MTPFSNRFTVNHYPSGVTRITFKDQIEEGAPEQEIMSIALSDTDALALADLIVMLVRPFHVKKPS